MNKAFISIGSNLGDRENYLAVARDLISRQCGSIISSSAIYQTEAWGKTDQPAFLNQVIELHSTLNARQLIRRLLKAERSMGRIREEKYGPRIIDLDLLFFNNEKHNYHFLQLPHPELQYRRFVLLPLAEIAPDLMHPVSGKTVRQLLEECPDELSVIKYS